MTGREKIEAALSPDGSPEFAAVTCYQGLFLRDHWEQATDAPWWAQHDPDPARAARPWLDMVRRTDEDWFQVRYGHSRRAQEDLRIEAEGDIAWQVNRRTGERQEIRRPPIGGDQANTGSHAVSPGRDIHTVAQLAAALGPPPELPTGPPPDDGSLDLPNVLLRELGPDRMPISHVGTPLWLCYGLWGFEGLMMRLVDTPELVRTACDHYLQSCLLTVSRAAAIGAKLIWIEDCMTDMISPPLFRELHLATLRPLVEAIRAAGMLSVHYFCGQPNDRMDLLLDTGADALSLEESKKTFAIDIMQVAERVDGRMALLGNLDAIGVLEHGSDAVLRAEIARQAEAGRRNRGRFVVSIGSPVTPGTPLQRVRRYCDLVHGRG
ncbi:MAG: uroporphyrinogen decarboxylase family protein [Armatimonadetes bacterium]|nr:uroporphyrinogen decarboxylase family protein [Armatimonadota bacterium]